MRLDPEAMRSMSDEHLISSLHAAKNELTDTAVETELLRRFELLSIGTSDLVDATTSMEMDNAIELLNILTMNDITDPSDLSRILKGVLT